MKNKNLKRAAAGSDLTNYEIELRAKLPLTKLSRIIHGAARPNVEEMERISRVLGEPPAMLFPDHYSLMAV